MKLDSVAPAESSPNVDPRGALHVCEDGSSSELAAPHTAERAAENREHLRVLSVKLVLDPEMYRRLNTLAWYAAQYGNDQLRAKWAEARGFRAPNAAEDKAGVSKKVRKERPEDLSAAVYSAREREAQALWSRHGRRVLAGAPLPEFRPNAALCIRGHKNQQESGVRLSVALGGGIEGGSMAGTDGRERFTAHLALLSLKLADGTLRPGGCWLEIPMATGTVKDYQSEILRAMAGWQVPISKAIIILRPMRRDALLKLSYALPFTLPPMGERVATLGPIINGQLKLRTESETRDYSGRLHTILERKQDWDFIRRRVLAQIGRRKGSARAKRKVLARMSWREKQDTFLHQWSSEMIKWLKSQGVGTLRILGLGAADWAAYSFQQKLTYKADAAGIRIETEVDLAPPSTERAVAGEIRKQRRRASKAGKAIRELTYQRSGERS